MTLLKRLLAAVALFAAVGAANATVVAGNFNAHGYAVVNISVGAASNVDFQFTNGYGDPTFSLFNAAGNHLVTNDDANSSLFSHLTQSLAAGNYSLMVSYCCNLINALPGSTFSGSDGFNSGSYWFGGSATLSGVTAYLDLSNGAAGAAYQLNMTNAAVGNVPEPGTLALFGLSILALGAARRRKQQA